MILKEFLRLFKSLSNCIMLILLICLSIPSIMSSLHTRAMFGNQLASPEVGISDSGLEHLQNLVSNYTGMSFYFDFVSLSQFYSYGYILLLMLWIGVYLSSTLLTHKEQGLGNLIVIRMPLYRRYIMTYLSAQTLYIISLVMVSNVVTLLLCFTVGGWNFEYVSVGGVHLTLLPSLSVIFNQAALVAIFACIVNVICNLAHLLTKNRYVLQALPLCGFTLLPFMLCSTVANLYPGLGGILLPFIPFAYSQCVIDSLNGEEIIGALFRIAIPIVFYTGISVILLYKNVKVNKKDYMR